MRSRRFLVPSGLMLAGIVLGSVATPAVSASARHRPAPRLQVTAVPSVTSCDLVPVHIKLENHTSLPLWFYAGATPDYYFTLESDSRGPGGSVALTWCGHQTTGSIWVPNRKTAVGPSPWIGPGKSKTWPSFPVAKLYDLTLPGLYQFLITTQSRLYTVTGAAAIYGLTGYHRTGSILYWPFFGVTVKQRNASKRVLPVISKLILIAVTAPYSKLPSAAVRPAAASLPIHAHAAGQWIRARMLTSSKVMPVMLQVWLRAGGAPLRLRLTGNPLVDFYPTQVAGPDGLNGDHLVHKPRPHYEPIVNWKEVPLTAYGKWLAKHKSSRQLKWKTYTLQPGSVYKYAVPMNLSCQFDMSLPGTYHVRLHLAGAKLRSHWLDVRVPR